MKIVLSSVVILLLGLSVVCQSPEDDEVFVSDIKEYNHRYYSGYLTLNAFQNENIHYAFFQSQNNVASDPIILYLAGGPGCSSLTGLFQQNGPFIYSPGSNQSQLKINPNSWNKKASLLYLDVPAGVGFSYSNNITNITDELVGRVGLGAINLFFSRYPQLRKNTLFLTGHGYSAIYVTYLSKAIIEQNEDPLSAFRAKINLGGILVGNPCTMKDECYAAGSQKKSFYHYQFLYNRAYFTRAEYERFVAACAFNYDTSATCYQVRSNLSSTFEGTNTSIYNLYSKCYKTVNPNVINTGCEDEAAITEHLNKESFKINWHINNESKWTPCSQQVYKNYFGNNNSYWLYPYLLKKNIRIWVYSGDLDASVPIIGTKKWIQILKAQLQIPILKNWRQWWVKGVHKFEDQVGGFIWELQGLTLVTVKGSGFRAGMDKPLAMSEIIDGFLNGKTLPYKTV